MPESELAILHGSSDKQVLVIDDIRWGGDTLKSLDGKLKEFGFQQRFAMVSHGTIFESEGLISPTAYNRITHLGKSVWYS